MSAPQTLKEAEERFSGFLRSHDVPDRVRWVDPTDAVWDRSRPCLLVRPTPTSSETASQRYAEGIKNGFGISLHAFSELTDWTIATIILPRDSEEAQRLLIRVGELKLSLAVQRLNARVVEHRITWSILARRYRASSRAFWADCIGWS